MSHFISLLNEKTKHLAFLSSVNLPTCIQARLDFSLRQSKSHSGIKKQPATSRLLF
jgi:hypothetical protein